MHVKNFKDYSECKNYKIMCHVIPSSKVNYFMTSSFMSCFENLSFPIKNNNNIYSRKFQVCSWEEKGKEKRKKSYVILPLRGEHYRIVCFIATFLSVLGKKNNICLGTYRKCIISEFFYEMCQNMQLYNLLFKLKYDRFPCHL